MWQLRARCEMYAPSKQHGGRSWARVRSSADGGRDAVNRFMRQAPGIAFSPSLGSTRTTCSYPWATSHRYDSPAEKNRQGISDGLVRLSVGVEELGTLQKEFGKGLAG